MRNPDRIEPFLEKLGKIWKGQCPDWRFGQFLINVFGTLPYDIYYWEDEKIMKHIENYFNLKEDN